MELLEIFLVQYDIYEYCNLKQYQIANVDVKDIGGKYEINIQIENDKRNLIR